VLLLLLLLLLRGLLASLQAGKGTSLSLCSILTQSPAILLQFAPLQPVLPLLLLPLLLPLLLLLPAASVSSPQSYISHCTLAAMGTSRAPAQGCFSARSRG